MFDLRALVVGERLVATAQIYNMLVVHAFVLHGDFPSNLWDWRYFERKTYYTIGGVAYSIGDLHHGVLRGNRVAPWDCEPMFPSSDPRAAFHAEEADLRDPRMLFVLAMHNGYALTHSLLTLSSLSPHSLLTLSSHSPHSLFTLSSLTPHSLLTHSLTHSLTHFVCVRVCVALVHFRCISVVLLFTG